MDHFQDAIKYWEQLEKLQPENPISIINIGYCFFHLKNYKKALKHLLKVYDKIEFKDKQLLEIIGICHMESKEYQKALEYFKEVESLDFKALLSGKN